MIRIPARDCKVFAVLLALDSVAALAATVWALVEALTDGPRASWWWVTFGVAVTFGTAAAALWFRRRAAQAETGGAA